MTDSTIPTRAYPDLHDHIEKLKAAGLVHVIDSPVNKDTEMHPLVRWQFRGGIPEAERKAFLFTNITDSKGRTYDRPVIVGGLATNAEIYRIGMGVDELEDIGPAWEKAFANPVAPKVLQTGPVHDVVWTGTDLHGAGKGLEALPIPISTPGFDAAPFLTMTGVITKNPETGVQNMGTYRGHLKSSDRLGMMILKSTRSEGLDHWRQYRERGEKMPIAIVVGAPPAVVFMGPQKAPLGVDEFEIAGALAGAPINVVRARTVDLMVPAEAELVIEGLVETDSLEPEGPFGESHGYVALEDYNVAIDVTAITMRKDAIIPSIISQVTPSESSVIKRLAYEPMFLAHLKDILKIKGIKRVHMHEPLTNLRKVVVLQFERGSERSEIWRALHGTNALQAAIGKFVIAVDDDIDPENTDHIFWAMSYRCDPATDTKVIDYREYGHAPRIVGAPEYDSAMLMDATMKYAMSPLALPKKKYMEQAKVLWEKLGLPELTPEEPWYGYSLGDWAEEWDRNAEAATRGDWMQRNESYRQRRRTDVEPNQPVASVEGHPDKC